MKTSETCKFKIIKVKNYVNYRTGPADEYLLQMQDENNHQYDLPKNNLDLQEEDEIEITIKILSRMQRVKVAHE